MAEKTNDKMTQLIAKALSDKTFKENLIENPLAVLEAEGIKVPSGMKINIVQNTDKVFHLVLPYRSTELSDDDLDNIAGGNFLDWFIDGWRGHEDEYPI